MGISKWPNWNDPYDKEPAGELVRVEFDEEQVVLVVTDKAIGIAAWDEDEVATWIPKSQIDGQPPLKGETFESLVIPKWLADEKGLL